jgi:hypothetical protein
MCPTLRNNVPLELLLSEKGAEVQYEYSGKFNVIGGTILFIARRGVPSDVR